MTDFVIKTFQKICAVIWMPSQQARIDNSNCSCEQSQQSPISPGVVADAEDLYFVLTDPDHWDRTTGRFSNAAFGKSKLWHPEPRQRVSVARKIYTGRNTLQRQVIEPQLEKVPTRKFDAVALATVKEIRRIEHDELRAFCVFDDGIEGFAGHGIVGASDSLIETRPSKSVQTQLRQKLVKCFQQSEATPLESIPEEP